MNLKENDIQKSILEWFTLQRSAFVWRNNSVGIYDPTRKAYRRPGTHTLKGVSDILGIWMGKPLAIEVKSKIGRVSPDQKAFLENFVKQGGIAFVARSLEDVIKMLKT